MKPDLHPDFRAMIDEALAAEASTPQPAALREHLTACAACRDYLDTGARVIASLGSYSFNVDPAQNASVFQALQQRAQQLPAPAATALRWNGDRKQFAVVCTLAVVFTVAGSLLDLRFGSLLASALHLHDAQPVRDFWLLSSLGTLLLFPLLPLLARSPLVRKERML